MTTRPAGPAAGPAAPSPSAPGRGSGRSSPPDPGARRRSSLGAYGETVAARHLLEAGMVLLDRNWRCEQGEIDLVLRDGRTLVVCEVKTRSSLAYGAPLEAVTERKAARLRRLAARWLADHDVHPEEVRIDLVGVLVTGGTPPSVDHVRGVG